MSFWKPFCAGALVSTSCILILQQLLGSSSKKRSSEEAFRLENSYSHKDGEDTNVNANSISEGESQSSSLASPPSPPLLDSPHLDMRLLRKAEGAIQKRTSRLTIVIERCTNDHNYSAILRTAEALGIQNVWLIDLSSMIRDQNQSQLQQQERMRSMKGTVIHANPDEIESRTLHHLYAQRATEWLTIREFATTGDCLNALRETGHTIWVTDLSQKAVCMESTRRVLPKKLAICFGTEAVGCSTELLEGADQRVYLPMRGLADSLNLSVATALVVHHLFWMDPTLEGAMSETERHDLRKLWFPKLASQRLETSTKKKDRLRLHGKLTKYEEYERKQSAGISLHVEQLKCIEKLPSLRQQLQEWDNNLLKLAEDSVADLILNPPQPITDMRRPDEHRTCYVGKNTVKKHGWADMPATTGYDTRAGVSMAAFFRGRLPKPGISEESTEIE